MLQLNRIFVTVGTTKFIELVYAITSKEVLTVLAGYQCKHIVVQYGAGYRIAVEKIRQIKNEFDIDIYCYDYKSSIQPDIMNSDLVISHAGAGSCIEVLTANKPLVVVVNENLMDNHQTELAEQLAKDKYLFYCIPNTLDKTLSELNETISTLRPYESGEENMKKFINYLDTMMGFE